MRICLVGEFSGNLDEGMRNVGAHLGRELGKQHQVLQVDVRGILSPGSWRSIGNFNPEIIHYIHGPTIKSFMVVKLLSLYRPNAKTVMSALHPGDLGLAKVLVPLLKPHLVLTLSEEDERLFRSLGCKWSFFPCGVDTQKFAPVPKPAKNVLREKFGLAEEDFIVLHVGPIKEMRNLGVFKEIQRNGYQTLIIGSTSIGVEQKAHQELDDSGCLVWIEYFRNIQEIYCLADCYIFPTIKTMASIRLPLSVMEAMACNLPVISTRFGALPRVFEEGNGLAFANETRDFVLGLEMIKNGIEVRNREKVLPYSWENVAVELGQVYESLLGLEGH